MCCPTVKAHTSLTEDASFNADGADVDSDAGLQTIASQDSSNAKLRYHGDKNTQPDLIDFAVALEHESMSLSEATRHRAIRTRGTF